MKTNHPLAGCFELVDNWPELFQQWQDEIEFANKEFNNIKKSGDKIISKSPIPLINNFVKTSIKGIFRTSLTAVADQLKNIVPDSEKVKYLEGIIQTSEELNMRFNESNNMNEYKGSIQDDWLSLPMHYTKSMMIKYSSLKRGMKLMMIKPNLNLILIGLN